jgi:hypothetical protein
LVRTGVGSIDSREGSVGVLVNMEMKIRFAKSEGKLLNV